jgi:hypothetical protein
MQNEQIDGLTINHSLAPLLKQEQMQALNVEELESSSKIDLRDVSWWMSIKDACRPGVPVIAKHVDDIRGAMGEITSYHERD